MPSNDANKTLLRAYAREDFHDKDTDWHSGLEQEEYESLRKFRKRVLLSFIPDTVSLLSLTPAIPCMAKTSKCDYI